MEIINNFIKEGKEKLHILTDFDGTLTKSIVNGKLVPAAISILRDSDYISKDYAEKAHQLADKYRPIEKDNNISDKEKKQAMFEWWNSHFKLLVKSGLNKKHLEKVAQDERLQFRKGVNEFLDNLYKNNIPLVIISSSGIGEIIPLLLKREGKLYDNIHLIINSYKWDKSGNAIGIKEPIITIMNKEETILKDYSFYNKIKNRKNVILLGDSIKDIGMVKGFDYNNLLKIGFLDEEIEKNEPYFKKNFDVILKNDSSFDYINKLMKEIIR